MHEQLDTLLCKRYPVIFSVDNADAQPVFGFECADGWFTLIDAACALIQRHTDMASAQPLIASQVKEKFGELRFYYRGGSDYSSSVVRLAESLSSHVCEVCGGLGKGVSLMGWMQTRCSEHASTPTFDESHLVVVRKNIVLVPPLDELLSAVLEFFSLDGRAAASWLTQPALALGHKVPLALAGSAEGQYQVQALIRRLEYGVLS